MTSQLPAQFASSLSTEANTDAAIDAVCRECQAALDGTPDLAMVFVSHHHGPEFKTLAEKLCDRLGTEKLLGCTGEAIVGKQREVEHQPALSLWLARLPQTSPQPMHLQLEQTPEGPVIAGWPQSLPDPWPAGAALLVLAEPFSFPADLLLERLNEDQPGIPVIGGMASGAASPGENRLLLGRTEFDTGAVALLLPGGVQVRTVVSQGCRPIGRHYVVTKAERNVIHELSGKAAMAQLQELFGTLSADEQQQLRQGLHLGRVINEYQDSFARGDFLIRNVIGADPETGAIAVGDYMRAGQTVQFHLRDAPSADEDLRELLSAASATTSSAGGLLFTCNGRGTRLFEQPDHDAGAVAELLGELPLAGFFAQGELGPIGGKNFLHGFTASLVLFE